LAKLNEEKILKHLILQLGAFDFRTIIRFFCAEAVQSVKFLQKSSQVE